ncbi:sugar transport protein 8-like [Coffea arabica]|uniref:Sugar transport protein 8-like n=1 Tax=Coffea arabica TaxID=13443 RepID=A0ABM4U1B4_COFAR
MPTTQVEKATTPQKIKEEPSSSWSTVKPQPKQSRYLLEIEEWTVEPESTAEVRFSAESVSITQSEHIMPTHSPRFVQRKDVINRIRILKLLALLGGITVGYAFNVSDFKSLMISSIIPLGASISVLPAHVLSNRWGRKPVLRIGLILLSVGSGLFAWLPLAFLGIVGSIMSGLGSGITNQVIPIICSELAPEENLSVLYGYQSLGGFVVLGIYLIASYSPKWVWRVPFGILCFLAVVLLVISFFIDESPRCLIQQDKVQAARHVFTKYRDPRKTIVDEEFAELEKAIEDEKKISAVKDLLSPQNRATLIIKAVAELVPQLLGASSLMFFGPLASTSVSSNSHILFITSAGAGLWGFLMTLFVSFFLLKRCGRRRVAIGSSFLTLLSQISLWVVLHFFANSHSDFTKPVAYTMIGAIALNYAGFNMLTNPYGWIKSSIEGPGGALADAWLKSLGPFMMVIMNVALIHMFCTIEAFVYVFTGFFAAFTTSFVYILVPEASQIGTYNMTRLIWMLQWFWKKFIKEEDLKFVKEEDSCSKQRV